MKSGEFSASSSLQYFHAVDSVAGRPDTFLKGLCHLCQKRNRIKSETSCPRWTVAVDTVCIWTGPPAVYSGTTPVYSSWSRLQDAANVIVLLTGAAYAVYQLYTVR